MSMQHTSSSSGKIVAGLIIMAVGFVFLLRQMNYPLPHWLFSWPMILIVVGLINGAKSGFRHFGWLILIGLGMAFLLDQMYPVFQITRYAWPLFIIGAGLFMILNRNRSFPGREERRQRWQERREQFFNHTNATSATTPYQTAEPPVTTLQPDPQVYGNSNPEPTASAIHNSEFIEITAVLGGIKRNILSKNVTGADITAFMGGAELNFSQADIHGRVVVDVTLIMGGCKLIVPSNWQVISEITAIMGGLDDKRNIIPATNTPNQKVLVLKGVALMGGIDIASYI
ncbi:hypothetical protein HUW51_21210 [Adhaeribacter swui]|uniref:LiaF transmembrane domain-containing protein n=1 Tax=Adhaeribacter swui TaxID=2086471 RepID=A0A7G7GD79_9BACT|nr:DUF5668 domain-containing protein [Adhaeribacter swui]QNF35113.1 hypothetical protein HUW51_21210 [Adhaeribacter swui]